MSTARLRPDGLPRRLTELAPYREQVSSTAEEVLPRPVRSSSSTSYTALVTGGSANRLRSRSLVQRKASEEELRDPLRLPSLAQSADETCSESSNEPRTPAEERSDADWPEIHKNLGKGKARELLETASDVVFTLTVPSGVSTPTLEAGPSRLPGTSRRRGTLSSVGGVAAPAKAVNFKLLEPVNPLLKPASEQPATLARPIAVLVAIFVGSTIVAIALIATVPTLAIPHSLQEAMQQTAALRDYASTSVGAELHIASVLGCLFIFKQAFSIPGSVLLNVIFGALYGVACATLSTCFLTAVGSLVCYMMARHCSPVVRWSMPKTIETLESRLPSRERLGSFLLLARLFPLLPYSALNIAAGVLGVPVRPFFWTLVLGSFPYNFVTTQCGELWAQTVASGDIVGALWTPSVFIRLILVTLVSSVPILFKDRLQRFATHLSNASWLTPPSLTLPSSSPPIELSRQSSEGTARGSAVDDGYFGRAAFEHGTPHFELNYTG